MRGKWLLFGGCAVLVAAAASAITVWKRSMPAPAPPPSAAKPVEIPAELSLQGKIAARSVVSVKAPAAGLIEQYLANTGEEVFEGQLLARIHNQSLENDRQLAKEAADKAQERANTIESQLLSARLEASRARAEAGRIKEDFARLERNFQRQAMLHREGATPRLAFERSQKEFDTARLEFDSTDSKLKLAEDRVQDLLRDIDGMKREAEAKNAEFENAELNMQATQIHSPVDGLILSRKGEAGVEIRPGEEGIFQLATDLRNMQVVVEPEPELAARLTPGTPASVYLAELGSEPLGGEVARVEQGKVIVFFQNPNPLIRPGLTAQVRLKMP